MQSLNHLIKETLPQAVPMPTSEGSSSTPSVRAPKPKPAWLREVKPCTSCAGGRLPDGSYCDCYQGQRERELDEEQRETMVSNRERSLSICFQDCDPEIMAYTWASYPAEGDQDALAYVRAIPSDWEGKRGLILMGGIGTGKTVMMSCLFRELIPIVARLPRAKELCNYRARFAPMLTILAELKSAMNHPNDKGEPTFSDVLTDYQNAFLLCIDDVGVEKLTPFVAEQFYAIINERTFKGLPTFMTTNLGLVELKEHLGPRCWSRLLPKVDMLEVNAPDLREQEALRQMQARQGGK